MELTNENIDKEIARLEAIRALKVMGGCVEVEGYDSQGKPVNTMQGGNSQDVLANTGQGVANTMQGVGDGGSDNGNGYYELKDCKVVKKGEMQKFVGGGQESYMQTIMFEYKTRKGDKVVQICGDAWNDTLKYNTFAIGDYYDLSLRIGCREKDGRFWPNVNIVFAHRLRVMGE